MNAAERHLLDDVRDAMQRATDAGLSADEAVSAVLRHVLGSTFLTPVELATRWHCTTPHLSNMRTRGDGPPYTKAGRGRMARVLYRLADIEGYERAQTFTSTTAADAARGGQNAIRPLAPDGSAAQGP